ncbi:MAG: hypothetical protein AABO58_00750 [Acidobacteriota bacterium]
MHRRSPAAVCLDQHALCRLNRLRRGTGQPLSSIVNAIVHDFLDTVRVAPRPRARRTRVAPQRRRA